MIKLIKENSQRLVMVVSGVWFAFMTLTHQRDYDQLQNEKEGVTAELNQTKQTLAQLVYTVSESSADLDIIAIPLWYKIYDRETDKFRMVYINDAFEQKYNVTRERYIGQQDKKVWGDSIANVFYENDKKAYWSRGPIWAMEPDSTGRLFPVLKWRVDRGNRVFIFGMELPDKVFINKYGR